MISIKKLLITIFLSMSIPVFAFSYNDWMNAIDSSCSPTLRGKASKLLNERSFWAGVDVSMDSWAQEIRGSGLERDCAILTQNESNKTRYLECISYLKNNWDWFNRCKPVVKYNCRQAGGYC